MTDAGFRVAKIRELGAEWFRLSLRFGWLDGHANVRELKTKVTRGKERLKETFWKRVCHGLELPYGQQAFALGLAPTPEVPKPPPKKKT